MSKDIDIINYKNKLLRIAGDFGLTEDQIIIVENRTKWITDHGFSLRPDEHPGIYATTIHWFKSDTWQIIIQRIIDFEAVIDTILTHQQMGFPSINLFKSNGSDVDYRKELFSIFTLLHEIAHYKGVTTELDANIWAYNNLKKYYSNL